MDRGILRRAAGMATLVLVFGMVVAPLSVSAATHVITLEKQIIRGEEGDRVNLGTFDTPADLVGQVCSVTASGNNNESVHPGNDIEVTSESTVVLEGVEDSANKTTVAAGSLSLSEDISFTLILGPDGVYSAELDVTLDCESATTTSTTTTTEATSTTSTTLAPTTTSTTAPPETSSTSITSTTVEAEPTTTTEGPEVSPTTVEPSTTVGETSDTLPFTGVGSGDLAAVAYLALAVGTGLVLLTRRRPNQD